MELDELIDYLKTKENVEVNSSRSGALHTIRIKDLENFIKTRFKYNDLINPDIINKLFNEINRDTEKFGKSRVLRLSHNATVGALLNTFVWSSSSEERGYWFKLYQKANKLNLLDFLDINKICYPDE